MGPGWFCDGCGDYRMRGEHGCYSVALAEMRAQRDEARGLLRLAVDLLDGDPIVGAGALIDEAIARWDEEAKR